MRSLPRRSVLLLVLSLFLASASPAQELGFEGLPAGELRELETELGTWKRVAGRVEVDPEHARSGSQCLHLAGGEGRAASAVELRFREQLEAPTLFAFWVERWTRRSPFAFTVEVRRRGRWRELYDGSAEARIGGFHTRVELALERGDAVLRLRSEAPEGTGVLIDDISLVPAVPMELGSVRAFQPRLPVLLGNEVNPVVGLEVVTTGSLEPLAIAELRFDLRGTTRLEDLRKVQLLVGDSETAPGPQEEVILYGELAAGTAEDGGELVISRERALRPGVNIFWLSVVPAADADIEGFVDAHFRGLRLVGSERWIEVDEGDSDRDHRQRMGVALRRGGDDGAAVYRIPGLVTTPKGTLIGVYDVRYHGGGDLPGHIDVGMSRSTDGGRTWEPMRVIMDMGDDPKWRHDGVGDPAVLVDRETGRILVIAVWSHGNRGWNGSGPGLEPEETGQLMLVHSDDDGRSWSEPRNLTRELKDPDWCFLLQGPGRGITMADGTLVFPAQFQLSPEEKRMPHSTVIYSRDHGESWEIGTGILANTTESAVVELADGVLMSNQRNNRGGSRSVYTSDDLGRTWEEHSSSRSLLREPVCMASLIHVGREFGVAGDGLLLFSNPDVDRAPRRRMTIKASRDSGLSWPEGSALLLDEGRSAGYSCLTMIEAETVGILYEGSRAHLTFQRVPLADVLAGGEARR